MICSSEKKLKQALLQFKTTANDKKRKLDTNFDEAKCRKLNFDNLAHQNVPIDSKNEFVNGDPKSIHDSVMDVDVDLCDDSNRQDENAGDLDTSLTNATCPTPETPKHKPLEALSTISAPDNKCMNSGPNSVEDSSGKILPKKSTPKLSKVERERLKQEKEKLKQEKEKERLAKLEAKEEEKRQKEDERKAKEEEKRQKAQAKEEERRQKEEERKTKEEEKRQKAEAKEEERRLKEEERKAKEEEKRQKDEEKRQRDEEKRLKDEEKRQKEELMKKSREKTAALFTNFFLKCKNTSTKCQSSENSDNVASTKFMPFEVKDNMRLACVQRVILNAEKLSYLDETFNGSNMNIDSLYLAQLRSKSYIRGHSENTWPLNANDDDDIKDVTSRYRCKLLQFRENRRPAYWGTWRKRSKTISGRRPFKLDSTYFEYENDSDDEWVDEEPGESLGGSDDDLESEDDYEVDNDMFVPHGYLSDEEGQPDEVAEESPKSHEQKLNILEEQFEAEMKEKTYKLKPRIFGCLWISNDVENNGRDDIENMLLSYRAVWNGNLTPFRVHVDVEISLSSKSESTPHSATIGLMKEFPESLMPDLIKLIHGNKLTRKQLVHEFKLYARTLSPSLNLMKGCLFSKIGEIASRSTKFVCWKVSDDIRQRYNLSDLSPAENMWKYIGNFETASSKISGNVAKIQSPVPSAAVTTSTSANPKTTITKFIRVYKASDKEKQPIESTMAEK